MSHRHEAFPFEVEPVAGVPFCVLSLREAVDWTVNVAANEHMAVNVRLANAWTIALAHDDLEYNALLTQRGVNFPDGAPVVWFMNSSRRGAKDAGRVRGPSYFGEVLGAGVLTGVRHFLLGASPDTLDALTDAIGQTYPGCQVVGAYSPPFAEVDEDYIHDCAEHVRGSGADLVWVGLGTPKQDVVGTALAENLGLTTISVGAAFDFVADRTQEAPGWVQKSGFEWLYRLAREPRRLWRRYTYGNVRFLWVATKARLRAAANRRFA